MLLFLGCYRAGGARLLRGATGVSFGCMVLTATISVVETLI